MKLWSRYLHQSPLIPFLHVFPALPLSAFSWLFSFFRNWHSAWQRSRDPRWFKWISATSPLVLRPSDPWSREPQPPQQCHHHHHYSTTTSRYHCPCLSKIENARCSLDSRNGDEGGNPKRAFHYWKTKSVLR